MSEDGKEKSVAFLANMAGAAIGRTWGLTAVTKATLKEKKKDIGDRPNAPKVVNVRAVPWEEQAQRRVIWSVDGALCRELGCAVAGAGCWSCSWQRCCLDC